MFRQLHAPTRFTSEEKASRVRWIKNSKPAWT